MPRTVVDREAFLAAQEAKLQATIAKEQRKLRLNRREQEARAEAERHHQCYLLGRLVHEAGLDEAGLKALLAASLVQGEA